MMLPVAILAGGLATRLRPITERIPKVLVDIDGRPFAEHQLELLRANGVTDVTFLVGHLGEMVQQALGDGSRWGMRLQYVFDGPELLGTGGAIRRALDRIGDRFFVLYGDSYLLCDYRAIADAFAASGQSALMTVCQNDGQWDRSNVEFAGGRIVRYDKQHQTPAMRHIDYGLGAFERRVFDRYGAGETLDLAAVYQDQLALGDLAAFEVPTRFYEIGSHAGLEETRQLIANRRT